LVIFTALLSNPFNFVFELAYINNMRGFIVIILYMCTAYFEQVHPLHHITISSSPTPFFSVWWVSLSCFWIYMSL
jgi:hypothetical protein